MVLEGNKGIKTCLPEILSEAFLSCPVPRALGVLKVNLWDSKGNLLTQKG